jgi:hypothetical protein
MIDAQRFTQEWIEAWNAHDLDAVLSHYADDFQMSSPLIVQLAGVASGTLRGKGDVRRYWEAGLERFPDLKFELLGTYAGASSLAIHYKGPNGRQSVEVFRFNDSGLVTEAAAHYAG